MRQDCRLLHLLAHSHACKLTVSGMPPSSKYISGLCPSAGFCFIFGTALVTLHSTSKAESGETAQAAVFDQQVSSIALKQCMALNAAYLHDKLVRVFHDFLQSVRLRYVTNINILFSKLLLLLLTPASVKLEVGTVSLPPAIQLTACLKVTWPKSASMPCDHNGCSTAFRHRLGYKCVNMTSVRCNDTYLTSPLGANCSGLDLSLLNTRRPVGTQGCCLSIE